MQVQSFLLSVMFIRKSSIKNCNTKPRLQLILDFFAKMFTPKPNLTLQIYNLYNILKQRKMKERNQLNIINIKRYSSFFISNVRTSERFLDERNIKYISCGFFA